jgi:hypothetical protein
MAKKIPVTICENSNIPALTPKFHEYVKLLGTGYVYPVLYTLFDIVFFFMFLILF